MRLNYGQLEHKREHARFSIAPVGVYEFKDGSKKKVCIIVATATDVGPDELSPQASETVHRASFLKCQVPEVLKDEQFTVDNVRYKIVETFREKTAALTASVLKIG